LRGTEVMFIEKKAEGLLTKTRNGESSERFTDRVLIHTMEEVERATIIRGGRELNRQDSCNSPFEVIQGKKKELEEEEGKRGVSSGQGGGTKQIGGRPKTRNSIGSTPYQLNIIQIGRETLGRRDRIRGVACTLESQRGEERRP